MAIATKRIGYTELRALVLQASVTHDAVRTQMLAPHPRKVAPRFNSAQIAELANTEVAKLDSKLRAASMPVGTVAPGKRRRTYSLPDVREILGKLKVVPDRPAGVPGFVLSCVNFKGGSTKTSTIFNLAQGLALRGRRVLIVDLDPQGSASTLTGLMPHTELTEADTAGLLFSVDAETSQPNLDYAIRKSYWEGLDIVPACAALNSAELVLPQLASSPGVRWWDLLNAALATHREHYDYILIDTAPSLNYLAINAVYASDGLLMPLPPEQLDFSAALVFWDMVLEIMESIQRAKGTDKSFKSIGVVLSKVTSRPVATLMKDIIRQAFGQYVVLTEIPQSEANALSGVSFGTIYDLADDDGVAKTSNKLRQAFDRLTESVDASVVAGNWGQYHG